MSAQRDLENKLSAEKALEAQVLTASADGATIDLQDCDSVLFVANVGASGDTLSGSVYIELKVEHSDDGAAWSDAAAADMLPTSGAANPFALIDDPAEDSVVLAAGYRGDKRYVRCSAVLTGTHTIGTPVAIEAIKGHLHAEK